MDPMDDTKSISSASTLCETKNETSAGNFVRSSSDIRYEREGHFNMDWQLASVHLTDDNLIIKIDTTIESIPLHKISKLERVDLSLRVVADGRWYTFGFENDGTLYDWHDDIYIRSPLHTSISHPFDFVHTAHAGPDTIFGLSGDYLAQYSAELKKSPLPGVSSMIHAHGPVPRSYVIKKRRSVCLIPYSFRKMRRMSLWNGRGALISGPTNFVHHVHVGFDAHSGKFLGLPEEWETILKSDAMAAAVKG